MQQGQLAQALLQLICCDDPAFLSLAKNGSAREHRGWIGFSEDDVGNRRRRKFRRGSLHANALRTTRSTVAILCDEAALLSLAKNGSAREQDSRAWSICHGRHCQKRNRRRERRSHC